ncbi:type II secretion system protein [Candidatus Gottesmanbacteria bacterium]|nr:type II secretion system protein [Candidatus Gottesmanbacteria bacterium]
MREIFNFQFSIFNLRENKISNKSQGFTLVEILVTATIIGLLSTIGISGFQAITRSGRDALRKSDLEQIRSALEIYKSENQKYPTATACIADLTSDYINPYPSDPSKGVHKYCYIPAAPPPALTYTLCAYLENGSTTDNNCAGQVNACNGVCNYSLSNP